ncbi:MAG: hypothetical protein JNG86_20560 [Verrucomicrobiaceae bacterium]|nr:hypothetical protein [Verrucomicrobiaceae bacterium]
MQNNTIPPPVPLSSSVTPTLPKRSFWKHPLVITLCVLVALGGIATATTAWWVKSNFDPAPFKPVALNAQEQQAFEQKIQAISAPAATEPATTNLDKRTLVITEKEVNAWLAKNELGESVQVRFDNGKISAAAILKLPDDFPLLAGQKIKLSLALAAQLNDTSRHFALQVDEVSVGGLPLPNDWIGGIKGMNLVDESAKKDPALEQFLKGIRKFEIANGNVTVSLNE